MTERIDYRIHLDLSEFSIDQRNALLVEFRYKNPEHEKMKALRGPGRFSRRKFPEYVSTYEQHCAGIWSFPRGAYSKLAEHVDIEELQSIRDETSLGDPAGMTQIPDLRGVVPRAYQHEMLDAALQYETCLLRAPQGSGKTTFGLMLAHATELPTLVIVPTAKIFDEWVGRAEKELGLHRSNIGQFGKGKHTLGPLTIATQQTIRNHMDEVRNKFGCVICDEAQRFAANTFFEVVDKLPAKYRVGITADETRADGKEFLIYDVFGPLRYEVRRETLIEAGSIIDAEIWILPVDTRDEQYEEAAGIDRQKIYSGMLERLTTNEERNATIIKLAHQCGQEGERTIVMSHRIQHCMDLQSMMIAKGEHAGIMVGEQDMQEEFQRTHQDLVDGKTLVAFGTYQAVGVGFNLPSISRGVFTTPCASQKSRQQFMQFCGRYERPHEGKEKTIIHYMWDRHLFGVGHVRNICRWKRTVKIWNGREYVDARQWLKEYDAS